MTESSPAYTPQARCNLAIMKQLKLAVLVLGSTVLFGCATSRSVVDVQVPPATANGMGQKVFISAIDERVFELKPKSADIPSLKNDADISVPAITQRALGRKRNGFGKGLGDVLLPDGKTLAQLVASSVAEGYRKAGYQVVEQDAGEGATQAVKVHIIEFWSWFSPGAFTVAVNNKAHLSLDVTGAAAPLDLVTSQRESMQMVTENDWVRISQQGLQAITDATAKTLCAHADCPIQRASGTH